MASYSSWEIVSISLDLLNAIGEATSRDDPITRFLHSSHNLSLKYLSAESHKIVTTTASPFSAIHPDFSNLCASSKAPTTAAPDEIPTSSPSSRARRFSMVYAASVEMP